MLGDGRPWGGVGRVPTMANGEQGSPRAAGLATSKTKPDEGTAASPCVRDADCFKNG